MTQLILIKLHVEVDSVVRVVSKIDLVNHVSAGALSSKSIRTT